jgi:branched chain amino acid efflux pump
MASSPVHGDVMLAIVAMTVVTVSLRLGGYFLMGYVTVTPRVRLMLEALPGSVIAAAILPVAAQGGSAAISAVLVAMLTMYLTRNDLVAVVAGVAAAALLRATGFA